MSSHGAQAIEPLTPLSQSIVRPQRLPKFPRGCLLLCLGHTSAFLRLGVDRETRRPPRPSPSPARESLRRVLIRDVFHHQGPFTGSGGRYSPGPTTDSPLLAMGRPLDGTLAPPWIFARTSPASHSGLETGTPAYPSPAAPADGFTHRRSLRARPPFTRPCRSFWSANAELIRGQTPPNDFCNCTLTCGQPNPSSLSSQGRRPRPPSFSYAPRRSFEQWCAASCAPSASTTPVLVLPAYAGLPNRDASESAPPPPVLPVGA